MTQARHGERMMFGRVLLKSVINRRARVAVAALAILLGATLVAALANLSLDVGSKVGRELRAYGANIVMTPRSTAQPVGSAILGGPTAIDGQLISEQNLSVLDGSELGSSVVAYAPYLYGVVVVEGRQVVLAGTRLDAARKVSPWWSVTGGWIDNPADHGEAMVGANVARELGLEVGSKVDITARGQATSVHVVGVIDSGGQEDGQIFVNLPLAQAILARPGSVGLVQVSAISDRQPLAVTAQEIERTVPGAQARILGQIADAEKTVYLKVQLLVGLVAALVLLAAALSVMSTMTTTVLERTREIALMKALGAGDGRIAGLFLSEIAILGLISGLLGCVLGWATAQVIGGVVFNASVALHWLTVPLTLVVAIGVALLSSAAPVRRAISIDPAIILRGE